MNPFYTHRNYLENELNKIIKNETVKCLEFGTGDGSAVIFKKFIDMYDNIKVHCYESDEKWLQQTKEKYESENYTFEHVQSWDGFLLSYKPNETYDLVFVDQSPWEARIKTIDKMVDNAKIIIIHDYDYYNKNTINPYVNDNNSFFGKKYGDKFELYDYYELLPPTLVMYNKTL